MSIFDEKGILLAIYSECQQGNFDILKKCLDLKLGQSDFINKHHQTIYSYFIQKMNNQHEDITLNNIIDGKKVLSELETIISDQFLPDIQLKDVEFYVNQIKTKVKLSELVQKCQQVKDECLNYDWAKGEFEQFYNEKVNDVLEFINSGKSKKTHSVQESLKEMITALLDGRQFQGIKTGYHRIDDKIIGLCPGQLIVVGARPSVGKTTFATSLMIKIAHKYPTKKIFYFSMEMTGHEISTKMLSCLSEVPSYRFKSASFKEGDHLKITKAVEIMNRLNIEINDDGHITVPSIASFARFLGHESIGLIVIDYLQLLSPHTNEPTRLAQITSITRDLKLLAKELKTPIVLLSQLNRGVENRGDSGVPVISDLRESGSIEQDADIVMLLHRKKDDKGQLIDGEIHVNIAKNRGGDIGEILLKFDGAISRVSN